MHEPSRSVSGVVRDPAGQPIPGAWVVFGDVHWDLTEVARGGGQRPTFESPSSFMLAPGEYRVIVSHLDYETIETRLPMEDRTFTVCRRLGSA